MLDKLFLLLFTFFSNARFFNLLFFKYICAYVTYFLTNEIAFRFNSPIKLLLTCYCWFSLGDENIPVANP